LWIAHNISFHSRQNYVMLTIPVIESQSSGASAMDYDELVSKVIDLLQRDKRVPYRILRRRFDLDDDDIEDLKIDLTEAKRFAIDENDRILVWIGEPGEGPESTATSAPVQDRKPPPISYTPQYLTEKILTSRSALEGERKQVTVMFADIKDSTELIKDLDPEDAQQLLDPAIHIMMDAVHRFEGTVNQVLGDGIMALFGAPIAHEDHAARACYAALAMQSAMQPYANEMFRSHGITMRIRVGLNAGEVVVRTIGNDLHMDYSAVGQTTHLASRMEQLAAPGSIALTGATLRLVEGLVRVSERGPVPVKGMTEPVEVYELTGASTIRRRLQAAVARGLTKFVGRDTEIDVLNHARERAAAGNGQIIAAVGEAGVGKSRLAYEFVHSHRTQGWLVLESASVSYGKATPYFPVLDLLKRYVHVEEGDDPRTIRAKVTGQLLTLDESLQATIPPLLSLLDALPEDSPFHQLDPPQRRQRTHDGLKRILLRESQVQPLLLVFEDLHWIDSETQALLDSLVESLPTAQILLLVNYRPEYQHGWGSKTYYIQLRLDPLPPESSEVLLAALLGNEPSLNPLKKLLIERTEGNPFFLEESVRTLVETEVLIGESGAYRLLRDLPTIDVPATVQAILAARIDRLSQDEKRLVQSAAVIGTEVPLPLLQAISDVPEAVLYRGMTHLQAAEFLYETSIFPERVYTFKHALTQNVAYQSLLTTTRQQYHQRIAQVLEARFPETAETQPELLAYHFTESGLNEPAIGYWRKAGEKAVQASANAEAINHLNKALALLATRAETPERAQDELNLLIMLGPALIAMQGYLAPEVEHVYNRAYELCRRVGEAEQRFSVLTGLRRFYQVQGDLSTAREIAEQLLTLAQHRQDPTLLLEAYWSLSGPLFHLGEFALIQQHLDQAIAIYASQGDASQTIRHGTIPGIHCLGWLSLTLWMRGYPDQALQRSHQAQTLARQQTASFAQLFVLTQACILHQHRREWSLTQESFQSLEALRSAQGNLRSQMLSSPLRGFVLVMQGQGEQGIDLICQWLNGSINGLQRPYAFLLLAEAYGKLNLIEEGLNAIADGLTLVEKVGKHCYASEMQRVKGELLLQQSSDNATEAEYCFQQAIAIAQSQQARSWELRAATSLARLWQAQGKRQEAQQLLGDVYGWFTEGFDTADLKDAKRLLDALR
jgi:class 3 adenylate cyclase/predicted ATPase